MKRTQLNHLLRNPATMARYQATGRLPEIKAPAGPLIQLLESIPPRYRLRITGLTIGPALGYGGSRQFHSAAQALNWCKPPNPGMHTPAESWRDKHFVKPLYLDDLLAHASSYPESMLDHLSHLLSPSTRAEYLAIRAISPEHATAVDESPLPTDPAP